MRETDYPSVVAKDMGCPKEPDGYFRVATSVSYSGTALILFQRNLIPDDAFSSDRHYKLLMAAQQQVKEVRFTAPMTDVSLLDVFSDGRVLLVASRTSSSDDLNACVVDPETDDCRFMHLGDGIGHCQIDDADMIWIAYFDEGIYGNVALGAGGLVCFTPDGDAVWAAQPNGQSITIDDCEALNISSEGAYFYYYADYALAKVVDDAPNLIDHVSVHGSLAFAVDGNQIAFSSGYDDPKNLCHGYRCTQSGLSYTRSVEVVRPDGSSVAASSVIGRGKHLHFIDENGWFRVDAETIASI